MSVQVDLKHALGRLRVSDWLTFVAGVIGAIAMSVTLFSFTGIDRPQVQDLTAAKLENLESGIAKLDQELGSVREQMKALSNVSDDTKMAIQIKGIDSSVNDLKVRHSRLEDVILNNPAKAIEVPLLRKDLDNLKDAQQQSIAALKQSVDQVYDINKWLLGAMSVGIVTLAVSNALRGREKRTPPE